MNAAVLALGRNPAARLRAARWATRMQFLALGFSAGVWGVHIPTVKAHYGLSEGTLSIALLAVAVGAVMCLSWAGRLVSRFSARLVVLVAGLVLCAALALVVHGTTLLALLPLMWIFGGASGLFDVSINAEGTVLEEHSDKKVMSNFHGMFSVGGMSGAGVGALLIAADVPPAWQLAGLGVLLAALIACASVFMLPVHPQHPEHRSGYRLPRGTLALLGMLAAVGLLAEGAMYDWSVLYMQTQTAAPPALAALGYASFSAAMAATRFTGDALRTRVSARRLLAASTLLAAVAMAAALLARNPVVALIGFALVGIGFANVVPILFIGATKVPGVSPAAAIATVSSVGYLGFVLGPPLVGSIAHAMSLGWALGVVVIGALLLAWGARRLPT
ncbi:MAG TPA: MFS transporter [Burkholderiaceae bacterium]|nr:MFS transporter [Burkholderiaceae bacterium]